MTNNQSTRFHNSSQHKSKIIDVSVGNIGLDLNFQLSLITVHDVTECKWVMIAWLIVWFYHSLVLVLIWLLTTYKESHGILSISWRVVDSSWHTEHIFSIIDLFCPCFFLLCANNKSCQFRMAVSADSLHACQCFVDFLNLNSHISISHFLHVIFELDILKLNFLSKLRQEIKIDNKNNLQPFFPLFYNLL